VTPIPLGNEVSEGVTQVAVDRHLVGRGVVLGVAVDVVE
jgi:hypothetical protein